MARDSTALQGFSVCSGHVSLLGNLSLESSGTCSCTKLPWKTPEEMALSPTSGLQGPACLVFTVGPCRVGCPGIPSSQSFERGAGRGETKQGLPDRWALCPGSGPSHRWPPIGLLLLWPSARQLALSHCPFTAGSQLPMVGAGPAFEDLEVNCMWVRLWEGSSWYGRDPQL